jgi:hypothetical protein
MGNVEQHLENIQRQLDAELGRVGHPGTVPRALDRISGQIDGITTTLRGTPAEPGGIVQRVDRLEQTDGRRGRVHWLAVTGFVSGLFALAGVALSRLLEVLRRTDV